MPAPCSPPAGLGGTTYGLTLWSSSGSLTTIAIAAIVVGLVLLVAFLWVEQRRGDKAMMPLGMFADPCFSGLNLLTFLLYGAFGAAMLLIPYVLIEAAGYSPVQAGLALLPLPILLTLGSPPMGQLAARIGPRWPLTIGPLIVGGGMLLAGASAPTASYWTGAFPAITVMADRHGDRGRAADLLGARLGRGEARRPWRRASTARSPAPAA